jgi:glycosyltransferase involved in cell wall biosynthesis
MNSSFCWLASFPRSGNTWVRNILYEVYGLESGTWDVDDTGRIYEAECFSYPVVKTHMVPSRLEHDREGIKAIYLVRDGRDAMVSIAHHRCDIISPGSDLTENMRAAIYAERGSFFGGWSVNVTEWLARADLLIRYEDLLTDPLGCLERIRKVMGLPEADYDKIPGFEAMKYGLPRYGSGSGHNMSEEARRALAERNFRRGKTGSWREEMTPALHDLFWSLHGDTMLKMGYHYDGTISNTPDPDLDWEVARARGVTFAEQKSSDRERIDVVIEADKLFSPVNDGVKRYLVLLLKELLHVHRNPAGRWHFGLLASSRVMPLDEAEAAIGGCFISTADDNNTGAGSLSHPLSVKIQLALLRLVPKGFKKMLERNGITTLHRLFDLFWSSLHRGVTLLRRTGAAIRRLAGHLSKPASGNHVAHLTGSTNAKRLIHLPLQHHYPAVANTKAPVVVTIHDFTHHLFPRFHTPVNVKNAARGWRFALRKGSSLIAVSQATADDAATIADHRLPPVAVIHEATDRSRFHHKVNSEDRREVCRKYGIPDGTPFFFTLSSIEPRKNLENVITAFFELLSKDSGANIMMVVGGIRRWGNFHPHTLTGYNPGKVHFTGYIDDRDLPFLLSEALVFCYVSHYEGFGLPLLEALNCGTPVIYGNNSSMPEVVGDAGLPADAGNHLDIALQMQRVFYDPALRERLQQAAWHQAALFSARNMARETLDCYLKTLN